MSDKSHTHEEGGFLKSFFHTHHHPSEELDGPLETSRQGIRAVKVSLLGLGLTALLQVGAVLLTNSVALLGDTLHNFADALTALPLWVAFSLGQRPRTRRYTYGLGKAEDLAGVTILLVIAFSAGTAGWQAIHRLLSPEPVENLPVLVVASVIGFAGNELVALYRIKVGKDIGSAALVADGMHSRIDGLTSLAVLLGAVGVAAGFSMADPIVGLLITVAILFILKGAAQDVFYRLLDAVDPELLDQVEEVLTQVEGVQAIDDIHLRWIGHRLRAEVEITVDSSLSVTKGHQIAVKAHHALLHGVPRLTSALVHANPSVMEGQDHHAEIAHHYGDPADWEQWLHAGHVTHGTRHDL